MADASAAAAPAAAAKGAATESLGLDELLDFAVRAVVYASRLAENVQQRHRVKGLAGGVVSCAKADKSPVTVADFAVQCLIVEFLSRVTGDGPVLRLMGEEDASLLVEGTRDSELSEVVALLNEFFPFEEVARLAGRAGAESGSAPATRGDFTRADVLSLLCRAADAGGRQGRFWVLDPIDGTKGFIRDAQYAVGLGLVQRGRPVLGAMACPNLPAAGGDVEHRAECGGWVFAGRHSDCAVPWAGALALGECLRSWASSGGLSDWRSACRPLLVDSSGEEGFVMCEAYESSSRGPANLWSSCEVLRDARVLRLDSMCKYSLVARGEAHIYVRGGIIPKAHHENIWDHCPGVPIVLAAGGRVTDFEGNDLDFGAGRHLTGNAEGILVTRGGALHDSTIELITRVRRSLEPAAKKPRTT